MPSGEDASVEPADERESDRPTGPHVTVVPPTDDGYLQVPGNRRTLIGRVSERDLLHRSVTEAATGGVVPVVLRGPTGIGKTRLLDELARQARAAGFAVCRGRGWEDLTVPYAALGADLFRTLTSRGADPNTLGAIALPRPNTGQPLTPDDLLTLNRMAATADVVAGIADLVVSSSRDGGIALLIDDAQWCDDATRRVLETVSRFEAAPTELSDRNTAPKLLVGVTVRTDSPDGVPLIAPDFDDEPAARQSSDLSWPSSTLTIEVGPLEPFEAKEMARLYAGERVASRVAELIGQSSNGNALFIATIAQEVGLSGAVDPIVTGVETTLDVPLPETVASESLQRQVAALDDEQRHFLVCAAVCGSLATPELVAEVAGISDDAAARHRGTLAITALLDEPDGGIRFAHPLARHALYTSVSTIVRKTLHMAVAGALLRSGDQQELAPFVAAHLMAAGLLAEPGEAAHYCRSAGDVAAEARSWGEAARGYESSLHATDRSTVPEAGLSTELLLLAGTARMLNLDLSEADEHSRAAEALARVEGDEDQRVRALLLQHRVRMMRGYFGQDLDVGDLASLVDDLTARRPELAARALVDLSESCWLAGRLDPARDYAERAYELAAEHGWDHIMVASLVSRATCAWIEFDLHSAGRLLDLADDANIDLTSLEAVVPAIVGAGRGALNAWWLGDRPTALRLAHDAIDHARGQNLRAEIVMPLAVLVADAVTHGDIAGAESRMSEALLIQQASGDHWSSAFLYPIVARGLIARGRYDDAALCLSRWTSDERGRAAGTLPALVRVLLRASRGTVDADEATAIVDDAIRQLPHPNQGRYIVGVGSCFATIIEAVDALGTAETPVPVDLMQRGLQACAERGEVMTTCTSVLVPRVLATGARLLGDTSRARDHLVLATDLADRLELAGEKALIQREWSLIHRAEGNVGEEATYREHAQQAARQLGLRALTEQLARD